MEVDTLRSADDTYSESTPSSFSFNKNLSQTAVAVCGKMKKNISSIRMKKVNIIHEALSNCKAFICLCQHNVREFTQIHLQI